MTTEETYSAVRRGETGVRFCPAGTTKGLPFDCEVALLSDEQWSKILLPGHTRFYSLALASIKEALSHTDIPVDSPRTILILSTTKAEVELLDEGHDTMPAPGDTARAIARELGLTTEPVVVCNACISGVAAQVLALRLLNSGNYDHAIVCGCDVQSRFIISGFQSLKALSPEPCRPFDMERLGLNLGEAAATMVFASENAAAGNDSTATANVGATAWHVVSGAVRNDAYHISGPHPKGLGAQMALEETLGSVNPDDIAVIGVHGTATMYNDQMESKAIEQAGLSSTPLSALKGYFGHTMGAAGVLETIITARALDDGIIIASKGFEERGVSGKVTISGEELHTDKHCFVKMLSGFGGCNGAIMLACGEEAKTLRKDETAGMAHTESITIADETQAEPVKTTVKIKSSGEVSVNGKLIETDLTGKELLTYIYKEHVGNYPKFYKMDILSRLAFLAVELLKQADATSSGANASNEADAASKGAGSEADASAAVVLFNRSSSIVADKQYEASICEAENFFPSPAAFVYTLPNITTGEIAIRHGIHGETSFYILPDCNELLMQQITKATMHADRATHRLITGWINADSEADFEVSIAG